MGTQVQCKSYLPGYYSMRDLNEDSNSCSWPLYYGDNTLTNGQYCNGFLPRVTADAYPGYDKDVVKRTMLEHEAVFKNQVYELHRLYRIQRDMMDEVKRKELHKNRMPVETSLSTSPLASQITSEDARKWQIPSFPLANSVCGRPSISGVEDIHSPLSCMKGNNAQAGPSPSQNGGSSKDVEVLEFRPTKVRKKMFDLQLPADQYIDTEEGEQFRDETVSGMPGYLPNGNQKIASESGVKLFLSNGGRTGRQGDSSRSDSCLRSANSLADLNEPIQVEETNASAYVDLLGHASCHGEIRGRELSAKPKSQLLGLPKEISLNTHHESNSGTLNNLHLENKGNGRGWFSHVLEAGHNKNNLKSISQVHPEKTSVSSHPIQVLFNKAHESPNFFLTDQNKVDLWRDRTVRGSEILERNHEISNNNHPESVVASNIPSPYPVTSPPDLAKSWSHSVSSWDKSCSSLSQKSISVQTHPYLNSSGTLSKSSQSSAHSQGIFGDRWPLNSNLRPNLNFGSELPNGNGFYHGSSSGSKELPVSLPSISYDYLNCSNDNNVASEHFINHGSAKLYKSSNCIDMKSAKDVNLNVVLSNSSSNEAVPQQGLEIIDGGRKHEDHLAGLPWLRANPSSKNEPNNAGRDLNKGELSYLQSSLDQSANKFETGKGTNKIFTQNTKPVLCYSNVEASMIDTSNSPCHRNILGFPIFEKPHISKNESSSLTSPSMSHSHPSEGEEMKNIRKNRVLDINLPCEPAVHDFDQQIAAENLVIEKGTDTKVAVFRHHIDLNSCVSEDEASLIPPSTSLGIDLEAPVVPETEDDVLGGEEPSEKVHEVLLQSPHKAEPPQDELIKLAAEAIVAISSSSHCNILDDAPCSPPEASMMDPLHWFVEIVSSCGEVFVRKFDAVSKGKDGENNEDSSSEGFDYFESMTLNLTEIKEEEYMPKPLVPENLRLEETGTALLPNRPRKGHARRGRQRRDFQRDILPGLASLSRHEVTEDLQTFGGLMRATGHMWHSGLTRRNSTRNGCARGRRRSVINPSPVVAVSAACTPLMQQLNNIEVGLEDRSLTGWGKTTRRPRRQRCPAGNPPSLPLT